MLIPEACISAHQHALRNAQAFGARQFEMVGVSLQRGLLICLAAFVMLLPIWLNFEPLMIAMGACLSPSHMSAVCEL